jgi:hypothetical protein
MKKTILKLGLSALLAANMMVLGEAVTSVDPLVHAASATKSEVQTEVHKIKGKITNISQKAKTIALAKKDKSFFLVKFSDATVLKGVESSQDFKVGEAIVVNYTTAGGENIATSLQKALVKLPEGIKEIKTKELAGLLSSNKDLIVVDARPPIKYSESHIPGSISVPYSKLVKQGDEGAKLFDKYKDKQLVFYCGGPT